MTGLSDYINGLVISIFTSLNRLSQRDEPTIYLLKPALECLGRKLVNRIIKPEVLKKYSSALEINLDQEDNIYIDIESVFLGCNNHKQFYSAAFNYFRDALQYIQNKFPLNDPCNAIWIDVAKRSNTRWNIVQ